MVRQRAKPIALPKKNLIVTSSTSGGESDDEAAVNNVDNEPDSNPEPVQVPSQSPQSNDVPADDVGTDNVDEQPEMDIVDEQPEMDNVDEHSEMDYEGTDSLADSEQTPSNGRIEDSQTPHRSSVGALPISRVNPVVTDRPMAVDSSHYDESVPTCDQPELESPNDHSTTLVEEGLQLDEREDNEGAQASIAAPIAPAKSRLMISHIVNENFKSYAGKHILGPFHKNFTSIVGPNGSGKSNVIDSILFVFGYRSSKIRAKKMSASIHSSKHFKNLAYCVVEVHFQMIDDIDDDKYATVPDSEFCIGRRVDRDNSSVYYIREGNNQRQRNVKYDDVCKRLRQNGIDIDHNRFLILQGEVEQISQMKPKAQGESDDGMLEYLEDIIGSSRLKKPIEELGEQVDLLNEEKGEKLERYKNTEKQRDQLEAAKNEALEFLKLENNFARLKHKRFQKNELNFRVIAEVSGKERDEAKVVYDEANARAIVVGTSVAEKKTQSGKLNSQVEKIRREMEKEKACFGELEKEDEKLKQEEKNRKTKKSKIQKDITAENNKLEQFREQPDKSAREIEKLNKSVEELTKRSEELKKKVDEGMMKLDNETKSVRGQKDKIEADLGAKEKTVNDAKASFDLAIAKLSICTKSRTKTEELLKTAQDELAKLNADLKEKTEMLERLRARSIEANQNLGVTKKEFEERQNSAKKLQTELSQTREKVEQAKSSVRDERSNNKVLDALMGQKRNKKIPGILARLGDLGSIDSKYDVAVSTAAGGYLDHILVDSVDTIEKCIEFLRAHQIGRANFMSLERVGQTCANAMGKISTPESVPRLFDLVSVEDEMILPAFYFALRDTLVANDSTQANRVGYSSAKRWRVVSLDGVLIETSGTMSGGGNRKISGKMGTKVRVHVGVDPNLLSEEQIKDLEDKAINLKTNFQQCQADVGKFQMEYHRLQTLCPQIMADVKDTENLIQRLHGQIKEKETLIKKRSEAVKNVDVDATVEQRLTDEVEKSKKKFETVENEATVDREKVEKCDQKINEITDKLIGKSGKVKTEVDIELTAAKKAIVSAKVKADASDRNIKKTEEKIESLKVDFGENDAKLNEIITRKNELTVEAEERMKKKEELHEAMSEVTVSSGSLKKELKELEHEEQELAKANMDVKAKLDDLETKFTRAQKDHDHWKNELNSLKLHVIDNDPLLFPNAPDEEGDDEEENPGLDPPTKDQDFKIYSTEELNSINDKKLNDDIQLVEAELKQLKPNLAVIQDYKKKQKQCCERAKDLEKCKRMYNDCVAEYTRLKKERLEMFTTGFRLIARKLQQMYRTITLGGDADLEYVDTNNPFDGVVFKVRPPKKSWKDIQKLSGGEKTLSSLALIFALHHYKPTPFYVMDEIDAALDFKNVSIVANYIKERTKNAQFIIISLRSNMFELANHLIGIHKTFDNTKSIVFDPRKIVMTLPPSTVMRPRVNLQKNRPKPMQEQN